MPTHKHFHKHFPKLFLNSVSATYLTKLGVVAAESYQLLADGTTTIGLPLALLGVAHHPLHLVAAGQAAVGVPALAGVHQALDAALDAQLPRLLRVAGGRSLPAATVKIEPELLHLVRVSVLLVTADAEIEVVTHGAVVSGLHRLGAGVAVVHELVLALH